MLFNYEKGKLFKTVHSSCSSTNHHMIFINKVSHDFVASGLIYCVAYRCIVTNELIEYIFSIVDTGKIY